MPSDLLITGPMGCGKTVTAKVVLEHYALARARVEDRQTKVIYVSRHGSGPWTVSALVTDVMAQLGLPYKLGVRHAQHLNAIIQHMNKNNLSIVLAIDEIDLLADEENALLYDLSRSVTQGSLKPDCHINVIGITNKFGWLSSLNPRVKSSLGLDEVRFPPYNHKNLIAILEDRAAAFKRGALTDGVIPACAGIAAREEGDARYAIKLLLNAGKSAATRGSKKVEDEDVNAAIAASEEESLASAISEMPATRKMVAKAIAEISLVRNVGAHPTEIFQRYQVLAEAKGSKPIGRTRLSQMLSDMEFQGLITREEVFLGKRGRPILIKLAANPAFVLEKLKGDLSVELTYPHAL
jgi:cell division control protein 6